MEQVRVGNISETHLSKQGWKNLIENFTVATNKNFDWKQHKNRWDIVKKEWQICDALVRGEIRLGWNVERQIIEATNEWWEAKLGYLHSSYFKFNSCINFLCR